MKTILFNLRKKEINFKFIFVGLLKKNSQINPLESLKKALTIDGKKK